MHMMEYISANTMDRVAIQSSAANPWFLCLIQSLAETTAMEKAEMTLQMATMVLQSDWASTSAVALSTQTIVRVKEWVSGTRCKSGGKPNGSTTTRV